MRRGRAIALGIALLASVPASASAAVTVTPETVTVATGGATVTVERHPFRMSFADAGGRTVLRQVENGAAPPGVVAPLPSPVPLGQDTETRPTGYQPLTFTVGQSRELLYPGSQWNGDELTGTEAGVRYSARDVVGAVQEGDGVRLTVSTSDPTGRQLIVTLTPGPGAAIAVSARPNPPDGVATMGDSFASDAGEAFHGFGGRHDGIDHRGQDFYNWIQQENLGAGELDPALSAAPGTGGHGYLFPGGSASAYYVQSEMFSSHGYGFLLDRDEISRWRMDSDRPDAWQVNVAAPGLDYVVAPGSAEQSVATLSSLGGRQPAPPQWGLGPMLDRATPFPNRDPAPYKASVADDVRHLAGHEIPLTGYRIEGWPMYDEPGLRSVIDRLKAIGIRSLVYFRSFVERGSSSGTDDPAAFDQVTQNGYAARDPAGRPYIFLSNFNAPAALIDFTNPAAVEWWAGRIRRALDLGADGFMQDFGEQTQVDMRFADGETGATMHNRYPVVYHRVTREIVDRYEREHPGRQIFWYTRAGYSGTPGSAAYEPSNFPGDETTDWSPSSGLRSLAPDMLNRAVGGAYGYNTDVGGYFDVGPYQATTRELFIRWAEWAALSPVMRLHGSVGAGTHTPWSFGPDVTALYRQLSDLHLAAAPYILRAWREADRTGVPVTRPLWLAYPGDAEAAKQDQEWLLGPDVLVAPVVEQGATSRDVYFPAGCWRSPDTGEVRRGPAHARIAAPLERLPFYFRCGTSPFDAAAANPLGLPSTSRCKDTRRFRFRIHQPRGGRIVRVDAYVNGRRVVRKRGRRVERLTLRRLPRGTFTVRIVARARGGRRTVSVRVYRGCRKGRPHTHVHRRR